MFGGARGGLVDLLSIENGASANISANKPANTLQTEPSHLGTNASTVCSKKIPKRLEQDVLLLTLNQLFRSPIPRRVHKSNF